jgi:hypothetical protein
MTSTEISTGPMHRSAPVDAPTSAPTRAQEADLERPLKLGPRILVWTGLAAAGGVFWLGVWKAIELIT